MTEKLTPGVRYKVRTYAIEGNRFVVYSAQAEFGLALVNYSTFSVTNNNNSSTFTISQLTDASDGVQTVYYRTVNGSVVGGMHFEHAVGSITFLQGESSKDVTVTEINVNAQYGDKPATAYSNASRTYELEIYRVDGGAKLKHGATRAMRSMSGNKSIERTLYTQDTVKEVHRWSSDYPITDDSEYEPPLLKNRIGYQPSFTCAPAFLYDEAIAPYVRGTLTGYRYRYSIAAYEQEDGWEHTWVAKAEALVNKPSKDNGSTPIPIESDVGTAMYSASFEIPNENSKGYTISFPQPGQKSNAKQPPHTAYYNTVDSRIIKDNGLEYFNM